MPRRDRLRAITLFAALPALAAAPGAAQTPNTPPAGAPGCAITGADRLRLILRHVDLGFEQRRNVRGLLEVYQAEYERELATLEQRVELVRQAFEELQAIESIPRALRDPQREHQARERLRLLAPGARAEDEFFAQLEKMLDARQREQLERARRGPLPPDEGLRAEDIIDLAAALELSADQLRELAALDEAVRGGASSGRHDPYELEQVARQVRGILRGPQVKRFDEQYAALRPRLPGAGVIARPATQPAASDAGREP